MDPHSEALDLANRPLPPVVIPEPLALYSSIDKEIAALEERLETLRKDRDAALQYAIDNNIITDGKYQLIKSEKTRTTRILDLAKFKEKFPEEYKSICENQQNTLIRELEHVGEKVLLKEVDGAVKKKTLEESGVVTVLTKVDAVYEVRYKPEG